MDNKPPLSQPILRHPQDEYTVYILPIYRVQNAGIKFELHDPTDDTSKILRIEGCRRSLAKTVLFSLLSISIIPLLAAKWSDRARRWLLYSWADITIATHVFVVGACMIGFPV